MKPKSCTPTTTLAVVGPRGLEAVGIALLVAELQRILGNFRRRKLAAATLVEQLREANLRPDAVVMIALGADVKIVLELLGEDHLPAALALVPEIFGRLALGDEGQDVADAVEPAHAGTFRADATASARDLI
jgi:hypothetical protein